MNRKICPICGEDEIWSHTLRCERTKIWGHQILCKKFWNNNAEIDIRRIVGCKRKEQWQRIGM
jgi:hypothetical protein